MSSRVSRTASAGWLSCAAAAVVLLLASAARGEPVVDRVVAGEASVARQGAHTDITAGHNAIIHFQKFDVAGHESVRFIQPGADARVLGRVISADPSRIDGALTANGHVYLVNPSGIIFGPNSTVNVGRLHAAAGTISNADFLAGIERYRLAGDLYNYGAITARDGVALLGRRVENFGSVVASEGYVTMAAGDEVYLSRHGSPVMVKVDNPGQTAEEAGVEPAADEPGGFSMGAGDALALSIRQGRQARVEAKRVALRSGGDAVVEGVVDASGDASVGGGDIEVTGRRVAVTGTLDASGGTGGGVIHVGGGVRGEDPTKPNALQALILPGAVLAADATHTGDGGEVVVWADDHTSYHGRISATGGPLGGDGGFAEVSGGMLNVNGPIDVSAPAGVGGTVLFDPVNVVFTTGEPGAGNAPTTFLSTGFLAANDGNQRTIITTGDLFFVGGSTIEIQARNRIETQLNAGTSPSTSNTPPSEPGDWGTIDLTGANAENLILRAGGNILIYDEIIARGNIELYAGDPSITPEFAPGGVSILAPVRSLNGSVRVDAQGVVNIYGGPGPIPVLGPAQGLGVYVDQDVRTAGQPINITSGFADVVIAGSAYIETGGENGQATFVSAPITIDSDAGLFIDGLVSTTGGVVTAGNGSLVVTGGVVINQTPDVGFDDIILTAAAAPDPDLIINSPIGDLTALLSADRDIIFNADVTANGGNSVVAQAGRHITVTEAITTTGTGSVGLSADFDSGGSGVLTITGTGSIDSAADVSLVGERVVVESGGTIDAAANLDMTGTAAASGFDQSGVFLNGAVVNVGGAADVTGTGAGTTGNAYGVRLNNTALTAGGDITVTGTGGSGGNNNIGVAVTDGSVESFGGNITLDGTGGSGTNTAHGVLLNNGAAVNSSGGTITIDGNASSLGGKGVVIVGETTGLLRDTAANSNGGAIIVDGTHTGTDAGVSMSGFSTGNGVLDGGGGDVTVTGASETGTGINAANAIITTTGGGGVDLSGSGGGLDLALTNTAVGNNAMAGPLALRGTDTTYGGSTAFNGGGDLQFLPADPADSIGVGANAFGDLTISTADLGRASTGFDTLVIGGAEAAGAVQLGDLGTALYVTVLSPGFGSPGVDVVGNFSSGDGIFIQTAGPIAGGGRLTAPFVDLVGASVGTPGDPLDLQAVNIYAEAINVGGGIYLANTAPGPARVNGLSTRGGPIELTNLGGTLTVDIEGSISTGYIDEVPQPGGPVALITDGQLTVDGPIDTRFGAGGVLNATGDVVINQAPVIGAGDVNLTGASLEPSDLIINDPITDLTAVLSSGRDILFNADVTANGGNSVVANAARDIVVAGLVATTGTGDVGLTADFDADGLGGVRVTAAGGINAAGNVSLTGSDLSTTDGLTDAVVIDGDLSNPQVLAGGGVLVTTGAAAPAGADVFIDGGLQSTSATGEPIDIVAAGDVVFNGGSVNAATSDITVNADADNNGEGAIAITGGTLSTGSGLIALGGGTDPISDAAHGSADRPAGVDLTDSTVTAAGGDIYVHGIGADGVAADRDGVVVNDSTLTAVNVAINGAGGSEGAETGVNIVGAASVTATTSLVIIGDGISGTGINLAGSSLSGGPGDITLRGSTLDIGGGSSIAGTGDLFLQPLFPSGSIGIGDGAAGAFNLSSSELAAIEDGFAQITVNAFDGSANVTLGTAALSDPFALIQSVPGGSGGVLDVAGAFGAGVGPLVVSAAQPIAGSGSLSAGELDLNAGQIGTPGQPLQTAAPLLRLTGDDGVFVTNTTPGAASLAEGTTFGGPFTLNHLGGATLVVSGPVTTGDIETDGAAVNLTSAGPLTVDALIDTGAGSGGVLSVTGGVTVNTAPLLGAGDIDLTAAELLDLVINTPITGLTAELSADRDIFINAAVTANGGNSVVANAGRDLLVAALVSTGGTGDITLTADFDADGVGGLLVTTAGGIDAAGNVTLAGSDLSSTAGLADAVVIEADGADTQVAAGGSVALLNTASAPAGALVSVAGGVTGSDVAITNTAGGIAASGVTATDTITLNTAGAITGGGHTADTLTAVAGGPVDLGVDVNTLSVDTAASGSDQTITSVGTDVDLAAGTGNIDLTSGGDLTGTISGADVTIDAVTVDLATTADTLDITTTGVQAIAETDGLDDVTLTAPGQTVTLTAGGAIAGGSVTADAVDITAAAVTLDTTVASLSVDTSAANGDQSLTESDGLAALELNAGTGNVTLGTTGTIGDEDALTDITANIATVDTPLFGVGRPIDLAVTTLVLNGVTTGDDLIINQAGDITGILFDSAANFVQLTSTAGSISDVQVLASSTVTLDAFGDIFNVDITTTALASLTAGGDVFNVTLDAGSALIDAGGSITDTTVTAPAIALRGGGIGTPAAPLAIDADTLAAEATGPTGGVFVTDGSGGLTVAAGSGITGVSTAGGPIVAATPGGLTLTQAVAAGGGSAVTLNAGGAITGPGLIAGGSADLTAASTDISVDVDNLNVDTASAGGDQVIDSAGTAVNLDAGTGDIGLTSGGDVTGALSGAAITIDAVTVDIATTANTLAVTTTGDQSIVETGGLDDVTLTAPGQTVTLTAGGAIAGGTVTADTADITATAVTLDTEVASLSVDTSAAGGDQTLSEADALTALDIDAGTGTVALTAGGPISDADGDVDLTAATAVVTTPLFDPGVQTDVPDLTIIQASGTDIVIIDNSADGVSGLTLDAGAGAILVQATLGAIVNSTFAGSTVTLIAVGPVVDVLVTAVVASIEASTIGTAGTPVIADVQQLTTDSTGAQFVSVPGPLTSIDATAGGAINLDVAGAIAGGSVVAPSATIDATSVTLNTTLDQLALTTTGNATVSNTGDLQQADIDAGGSVDLAAGDILAGLIAGNAVTIDAPTVSVDTDASSLDVTAPGGATINEADGLASLILDTAAADAVVTAGGAIAGGTVNARRLNLTAPSVTLTTSVDDLTIDTSAANGPQTINELTGLLALDLDAGPGGTIDLTAGGAVLDSDPLIDLRAASATVTAPTVGVLNTDVPDLTINTTSGDGFTLVDESAGGISNLVLDAGDGVITLEAPNGDIRDSVLTASEVVLRAGGVIDNVTITAIRAVLEAASIGTAAAPIQTDVSELVATSTTDAFFNENGGLDALALDTGRDAVVTAGGGIAVSSASAGSSMGLTAGGAITAATPVTAPVLTLDAGRLGNGAPLPVNTASLIADTTGDAALDNAAGASSVALNAGGVIRYAQDGDFATDGDWTGGSISVDITGLAMITDTLTATSGPLLITAADIDLPAPGRLVALSGGITLAPTAGRDVGLGINLPDTAFDLGGNAFSRIETRDLTLGSTDSGDMTVGRLVAGPGVTTLNIISGGIIDEPAGDDDAGLRTNIIMGPGGMLNLRSGGRVGSVGGNGPLDTDVDAVSGFVAAPGTFNLANLGDLVIADVFTTSGDIFISTTGAMAAVQIEANSDTTLVSGGDLTVGTLDASETINLTAGGAILARPGSRSQLIAPVEINATATSFGTAAVPIATDTPSLNINTSAAGGDQHINQVSPLTQLFLNAGTGSVFLNSTSTVNDADPQIDIVAGNLQTQAVSFGTASERIQLQVSNLSIDTSGSNGVVGIGDPDGLLTGGSINTGTGDVTVGLPDPGNNPLDINSSGTTDLVPTGPADETDVSDDLPRTDQAAAIASEQVDLTQPLWVVDAFDETDGWLDDHELLRELQVRWGEMIAEYVIAGLLDRGLRAAMRDDGGEARELTEEEIRELLEQNLEYYLAGVLESLELEEDEAGNPVAKLTLVYTMEQEVSRTLKLVQKKRLRQRGESEPRVVADDLDALLQAAATRIVDRIVEDDPTGMMGVRG